MTGECEVCGCTEDNACPGGCVWANSSATLCSRCAQDPEVAQAFESVELLEPELVEADDSDVDEIPW